MKSGRIQDRKISVDGGEGVQAVLQTVHLLLKAFKVAMLILLLLYFLSGAFIVKPDEEAFILRFGKVVGNTHSDQIIKSGQWHWAWPRPVDQVIRIPVKQSRTLHTDHFWYSKSPIQSDGKNNSTPSKSNQPFKPGVDGYLLTGDYNIVHAEWSLTYFIKDPIQYYSSHSDPEESIINAFQNTIVAVTAKTPIHEILYGDFEEFKEKILKEIRSVIGPMGLGILVNNISCVRREPPQSVISSFTAVTEAEQKKSQTINRGRGYRERIFQETSGKYARTIAEAEGYKSRIIASVEADSEYFKKIFNEYQKAPETMLLTLHTNALSEILEKVERKYIIHSDKGKQNQEIRLLIGNEADFIKKFD